MHQLLSVNGITLFRIGLKQFELTQICQELAIPEESSQYWVFLVPFGYMLRAAVGYSSYKGKLVATPCLPLSYLLQNSVALSLQANYTD
jgi:hypothetical protein